MQEHESIVKFYESMTLESKPTIFFIDKSLFTDRECKKISFMLYKRDFQINFEIRRKIIISNQLGYSI